MAALPAPISRLPSAFRFGISPGGIGNEDTLGEAVADG